MILPLLHDFYKHLENYKQRWENGEYLTAGIPMHNLKEYSDSYRSL